MLVLGRGCLCRLLLNLAQARLDVLDFYPFDCHAKNALGSPEPDRRRHIRIRHELQNRYAGGTGGLLNPRDGLAHRLSACLKEGSFELALLHPSPEGTDSDTDGEGSLFCSAVGKERSNGLFLLPPEFCAVAFHLLSPAIICGRTKAPSPVLRQSQFPSDFARISGTPE